MTRVACMWLLVASALSHAAEPPGSADLAGIWEMRQSFGPEIAGPLYVQHRGAEWLAEAGAYRSRGEAANEHIVFDFGATRGALRMTSGADPTGHWIQPKTRSNGTRYASPARFTRVAHDAWRVDFRPLTDSFTLYLVISRAEDGRLTGYLRNPERNVGIFQQVSRIDVHEGRVNVFSRFRGRGAEQPYLTGSYDVQRDRLVLTLPFLDTTAEFARAGDHSGFYARGRAPDAYRYVAPPPTGDGWETGTLDEVNIASAPLVEMIEKEMDVPPGGLHAPDLHAVLIARHGRLVFEEYFHGFNRQIPHDTRSASKSATATLYGAAIQAGRIEAVDVNVFATVPTDELPSTIDPRSRMMTAEHLLTQTSGFYCDDNDPDAPGNEDAMQEQTSEPDWYRYTLAVPMSAPPGSTAVYCSANTNLLGLVISAATGQPLEVLFQHLLAEPLGVTEYHMNLQPTGEPYMGGGLYWLPRDFIKLGQLYLDGGVWRGRRILSEEWVKRATTPLVTIGNRGYGYQWWVEEYPTERGTVKVFYAGGNGGQVVAVAPQLDLVVAFYGGNYSDPVLYRSQNVLFPQYVLKAVGG